MGQTIGLLAVYLGVPALLMFLQARLPVFRKIGAIVPAYAVGILLSVTGLSHSADPGTARVLLRMQSCLQNICVPLGIPLLLFSADFKQWRRRWKQVAVAFVIGIVAVMAAVTAAYYMFRGQAVPELEKAAGLMIGFYTGGTPNVASLKMALRPSAETFLLVNSFEIVITFFLLAFLILGGYKLLRRWLPYERPAADVVGDAGAADGTEAAASRRALARAGSMEDYRFMFRKPMLTGWLTALGLAVLTAGCASAFSLLFPADYRVVAVVLGITTLSIAASFVGRIRRLPKSFELGMYFILVFSIVIASDFSMARISPGTESLFYFIATVLGLSLVSHFLLAKLCRVEADTFTISMTALIFSPPFVPTVAGAMGNRGCMLTGIVVGLLGYALGNYLGIGWYMLVH
ncbi:MAG: DUF819 family protein [Bacteroidales bacterium]|nr:DUF819 family protein [Bacteroidales bacterium]